MSTLKIFIEQLTIETFIGVYDWEKKLKQKIIIDLICTPPHVTPYLEDKLENTLNYKTMVETVIEFCDQNHFNLLEALAENLSNHLYEKFNITYLYLKINKPFVIPKTKGVGVILEKNF
ncbi:MAG: dihydroneopterin aldolase [Francisellaceae bacterium]|nr:dihydroneopterin aldolase [Francisellaceae bacterium]